ncbi:hypothetical protein FEM48_Zijuj04G0077400 [Ziziphus jujuba var. spinosa]|uniref:Uncharacterized protein n=1 Tax=Ziziphus jujuba var. spinosa TaxID=714518 RepID=A0A978VIM7_ZIZJJ|nr:hypothetical protein FEM48_Zijuj04G0077400 [Ziziphus jujuba var. spinosa]
MGRAPCCDKNGLKKGLQRCGKSCRLRWTNYLRPDIKRGRFSFEEEETIIQLHSILGNKWSAIAARLPGRTDNEIKNYWNTHIRKRLLRMGIDPVTHAPRLDFLDLSSILGSSLCNPTLVNLSTLLGGSQALFNPDFLRLAATLMSLKQENNNPDLLTQNFNENINNQLFSAQLPNNQFQTQLSQQGFSTEMVKQLLMQANADGLLSNMGTNFECPTNTATTTTPQNNIGIANSGLSENDFASQQPSYLHCGSNPLVGDLPENLHFQSVNDGGKKDFDFDSTLSTPLSSPTPLNSSSTYINSSSTTEDEKESYCSDFFKFEIPEGLDINEFM